MQTFHAVGRAFHIQVGRLLPGHQAHHAALVLHDVGREFQLFEAGVVHVNQEEHLEEGFFHFLVKGAEGQPQPGLVEIFEELQPLGQPVPQQFHALGGQGNPLGQQPGQAVGTGGFLRGSRFLRGFFRLGVSF